MTIQKPAAMRVAEARYGLRTARGHDLPETPSEVTLDSVLTTIAELVQPGRPDPTKASLAAAVEDGARIARKQLDEGVCSCGHRFADHVGHAGCFLCDVCKARRPQPGAEVAS